MMKSPVLQTLYRAPAPGMNTARESTRTLIGSCRRQLRLQRFIREQRLSPAEATFLPANFNPGPEYDCP